ncbi:MAG TPA: hypothetical protein VGG99_08705 [Acetobacteraceae bacterium]|jgi:hypothetical protein
MPTFVGMTTLCDRASIAAIIRQQCLTLDALTERISRFPQVFREPALALTAAGRPPDAPAEQDADVAAILRVARAATGPP